VTAKPVRSLSAKPETGPLEIVAESPELSYSPFHMLGSSLASCIASVLLSWSSHAKLDSADQPIHWLVALAV
jgi:hypothetical protein